MAARDRDPTARGEAGRSWPRRRVFRAQAELSRPAALRWGRGCAVCVSRGEPRTPRRAHGEAPRALHAAGAAREPARDSGGAGAGRAGVGVRYPRSSGSDRRRSREPRGVTWLIKESFTMTVPQTLKTCTLLALVVGCAPREPGTRELSGEEWIDVTATLDPATTPVYAGDAPMKFDFLKDMRKGDKLTLSVYSMGAHSGTHIDAPMHFVATGVAIDQVSLDPLIGAARVIDIPDSVQAIDAGELNRHDWRGAQRLLFRTRSTLRGWMDSSAFHRDFAYVAPDAAQLLADAGVLLVGVDYISAEQFGASAPRTHQILLGRGIPIVEGLDLRSVQAGNYDLIVLPIKVRGHEGAPARAIARPVSKTAPRR